MSFSQSLLDRIIVPVYFQSEFSYGYDDNYLKLSNPEQQKDLEYRLGDSNQIDSYVSKNKIKLLYIPYIFNNHETKFDFAITTSKYFSSNLKSYNNYHFKFSQHLAAYTWFKFSYGYTPSFYIKSYSQSDPYMVYDLTADFYMPSSFSSEKFSFEFTAPIPYLSKVYFSTKYIYESQYYNADFTEFDLEIMSYYLKIRKKILKKLNISIAYMNSVANNTTYMNGLLSTSDKDRSYSQYKVYTSFSTQKLKVFDNFISLGIYSIYENRQFLSILELDRLHFMRSHQDVSINYWLKGYLSNNFDFKIKFVNRYRDTSSPYNTEGTTVNEFKSFKKFELWLSLILKMELNVYR